MTGVCEKEDMMKKTGILVFLLIVLLVIVALRYFFGGDRPVEPTAEPVPVTSAETQTAAPTPEAAAAVEPEMTPAAELQATPEPVPTYIIATGNEAETFESDFEPLPVEEEYVVDVQGEQFGEAYG